MRWKMSERGSFCTEYIYCDDCFEACKQVLLNKTKWLYSEQIGNHPIIAGKIGGMYSGEEFHDMENEYIPKIQELMNDNCTIRICVHSDCNGSVIYEFDKDEIISEVTNANE
jgi:hypothetical protein